MKNALSLLMALIMCVTTASCAQIPSESTTPSESKNTSFTLSELSNPFIGRWQSEIPSAGTTLIFDYKNDGTFDYEMVGVPVEQGGVGTGGYIVYDDIQVTWLDFEGAAAYTFNVIDNDTINVTELEMSESGELVQGNTAPFTRVPDSPPNKEDTAFALNNAFIGKWQSDIPSAGMTLIFDYKTDGTFDYEMVGVPVEEGGVGTGCYFVYGDKQVTYLDFEGAASYSYEVINENIINMTELLPDENGGLIAGNTTPFTRIAE